MVNPRYCCSRCNYQCENVGNFRLHLDTSHTRETSHWCKRCGKLFADRNPYIEHQHDGSCPQAHEYDHPCGFEGCHYSDRDPTRFIFHLKNVHRGKPLLPCIYCRRLFTIPSCLIAHIQDECCNRPSSSSMPAPSVRPPNWSPAPGAEAIRSSVSLDRASSSTSAKKKAITSSTRQENEDSDVDVEDPGWVPFNKSLPAKIVGLKMVIDSDSDSTMSTCSTVSSIREAKSDTKRKNENNCFTKPTKRPKQASSGNKVKSSIGGNHPDILDWNQWACILGCNLNGETNDRIKHFFKCVAKGCQFSTNSEWDFAQHVNQKHGKGLPFCCYCFFKPTSSEKLARHMVKRHYQRIFQCSDCLFRAASEKHVKEHQKAAHSNLNIRILACSTPSSIDDETVDIVPAKSEEHKTFKCGSCNFRTLLKPDFVDHCQTDHPNFLLFDCSFCEFSGPLIEELLAHFRIHGIRDYECDYCSFGAENSGEVLLHLCIYHADEKLQYLNRQWPSGEKSTVESPVKVSSTTPAETLHTLASPDRRSSEAPLNSARSSKELNCRIQLFKDDLDGKNRSKISSTKHVSTDKFFGCPSSDSIAQLPSSSSFKVPLAVEEELNLELSSDEEIDDTDHPNIQSSSDDDCDFDKISVIEKQNSDIEEINLEDKTPKTIILQNPVITNGSSSEAEDSNTSLSSIFRRPTIRGAVSQKTSKRVRKTAPANVLQLSGSLNDKLESPKKLTSGSSRQKTEYLCVFCDKICSSIADILEHAHDVHKVLEYFQCSLCTFKGKTSRKISYHGRSAHMNETFQVTNLVYSTRKVKTISESTTITDPYICVFCNHTTDDETNITLHLLSEMNYFKYCCKHCTFRARDPMTIVRHCQNNHQSKSSDVESKKNVKLEKWAEDYVSAQKRASLGENVVAGRNFNYQVDWGHCGMCSLVFSSHESLKGHLYTHLQYKPHKCLICEKGFTTLMEFNSHHDLVHEDYEKSMSYHSISIIEDWTEGVIEQAKRLQSRNESLDNVSKKVPLFNDNSFEDVVLQKQTKKKLPLARKHTGPLSKIHPLPSCSSAHNQNQFDTTPDLLTIELGDKSSTSWKEMVQNVPKISSRGEIQNALQGTPKFSNTLFKEMSSKAITQNKAVPLTSFSKGTARKSTSVLSARKSLLKLSDRYSMPVSSARKSFSTKTYSYSTSVSSAQSNQKVLRSEQIPKPSNNARKSSSKALKWKSPSVLNVDHNQKDLKSEQIPKPSNNARKSTRPTNPMPESVNKNPPHTLSKGTARKSVSHHPQAFPNLKKAVFKATARKSTSKPLRTVQIQIPELGFSRYGFKPLPPNLENIYILTKPPGYEYSIRLSGYYIRDMFRRDVRVVLQDYHQYLLF